MKIYQKIIKEICEEENIKLDIVSNNWIYVLEKDGRIKYMAGSKFQLNEHSVAHIIDDKYALFDVLNKFDIPVLRHYLFYKDYDKEYVKDLFYRYNEEVVVKANTGMSGKDVYRINSLNDLYEKMDYLFETQFSISFLPYYDIKTEYRLIVLDGELELLFAKVKPVVIGDGVKSIKELLMDFNPIFFESVEVEDRVLAKEEVYEYSWKFNLARGALAVVDIDLNMKTKLLELLHQVLDVLDIRFASVDLVDVDGKLYVLEINSGVDAPKFLMQHPDYYDLVKNIYRKAVKKMFEE